MWYRWYSYCSNQNLYKIRKTFELDHLIIFYLTNCSNVTLCGRLGYIRIEPSSGSNYLLHTWIHINLPTHLFYFFSSLRFVNCVDPRMGKVTGFRPATFEYSQVYLITLLCPSLLTLFSLYSQKICHIYWIFLNNIMPFRISWKFEGEWYDKSQLENSTGWNYILPWAHPHWEWKAMCLCGRCAYA